MRRRFVSSTIARPRPHGGVVKDRLPPFAGIDTIPRHEPAFTSLHRFTVVLHLGRCAEIVPRPRITVRSRSRKRPPMRGSKTSKCGSKVSGTAEFAIEKGKSLVAADRRPGRSEISANAGCPAPAATPRPCVRCGTTIRSVTEIQVADHATSLAAADDRRLIVAQGRREGILFYSPAGPLTAADLELLRAPADTLCLVACCRPSPLSIGDKWTPPSWAGQMLTDTEAASKSELTCTLESVADDKAKVDVDGHGRRARRPARRARSSCTGGTCSTSRPSASRGPSSNRPKSARSAPFRRESR